MMTLREWLEAREMTVIDFADEVGLDHSWHLSGDLRSAYARPGNRLRH